MEEVNLKIIPDIPCEVYVDYEFITVAKKGTMTKILLCRGEYAIRLVSTVNSNYYIEDVIMLEYDKVWKVAFTDLVERNPELRKDSELQINDNKIYDCLLCREIHHTDEYDDISRYYNKQGWIRVKHNNKWGFISSNGVEVIPCIYDWIYQYQDGLARAEKGDWNGFLDTQGNEVFTTTDYVCYDDFSEGLAKVHQTHYSIISSSQDKSIYGRVISEEGIINIKQVEYRYGFIDTTGNIVIPCIYKEVESFKQGLAKVKKENGGWGFINKMGEEVISCIYEEAESFIQGLAKVKKQNEGWGYIDKAGKEVIPCKYRYISSFCKDIAKIELDYCDDETYKLINKSGEEFFKIKSDYVIEYWNNEGCAVKYNGKMGYFDLNGKEVIPCIYTKVGFNKRGLLICSYNRSCNEYEILNTKGQIIAYKGKYDLFDNNTSEEKLIVRRNQKWGCINTSGIEIIPCEYDDIIEFQGGIVWLNRNGRWLCKTKKNETMEINVFDGISFVCSWIPSSSEIVSVKNHNEYIYLDKYGNIL